MSLSHSLKKARERRRIWDSLSQLRPDILLCPNIPKPMHGVAPREILGTKWWNKTRKASYSSTLYHCLACGVHKLKAKSKQWLEGHELYTIDYKQGRMTYVETVPLCHYCHNYIHDGRLLALLGKNKIRPSKYLAIIKHGDRVLAASGLCREPYEDREQAIIDSLLNNEVAKWKDWRLVLFGKHYPPKFKSPQQWQKAFEK